MRNKEIRELVKANVELIFCDLNDAYENDDGADVERIVRLIAHEWEPEKVKEEIERMKKNWGTDFGEANENEN